MGLVCRQPGTWLGKTDCMGEMAQICISLQALKQKTKHRIIYIMLNAIRV